MDSIALLPDAEIIRIFAGVIRLWLECVISGFPAYSDAMEPHFVSPMYPNNNCKPAAIDHDDSFYDREKEHLFQRISNVDTAVFNILRFFITAARRHNALRIGLLHAGGLSLVLTTFVNVEFQLGGICRVLGVDPRNDKRSKQRRVPLQPIPLDAINNEASTLTVLMYDPLFQQNWEDRHFEARKALCSHLVDVLTRDISESDSRYQWSRALFKKITVS